MLSPGGTGLGVCAPCQMMPIPSAQHPTLPSAEIMESQHHLDWKKPSESIEFNHSPSTFKLFNDRKLHSGMGNHCSIQLAYCHLQKGMWSCFSLTQLIRPCTAALGLSLVYRLGLPWVWTCCTGPLKNTRMSVYRDGKWGCPWCQQPLLMEALPQLHPTPQHCLSAPVSLWQSPTALLSACLGNTSPSAWR